MIFVTVVGGRDEDEDPGKAVLDSEPLGSEDTRVEKRVEKREHNNTREHKRTQGNTRQHKATQEKRLGVQCKRR